MRNTFQRLRPEEFFLNFIQTVEFDRAEICDISGRKLRIFQRGAGKGWEERGEGRKDRGEGGRGLTGSLWPTQCRLETQVEGAEHVNFLCRRLWKFDSYS